MIKLKTTDTITCDMVEKIYKHYPNEKIIVIIPNTKMQSSEKMREIASKYPNIIFSVTGGLDPVKKKFNNEHYQERTYFTAMELSKIIDIYRGIERCIALDWTETQKAMFVYKQLCDRMEYSEISINGKDYARGIGGLLYNKAVCSGFAMIFKEAMDRLGIECYYQNRRGHHSWNIAKIDGKYRSIELTWDVTNKGKYGCNFYFFNRLGEDFYSNEHHNIAYEDEERIFPITQYTDEELKNNYRVVTQKKILRIPMTNNPNKVNSIQTVPITIEKVPAIISKNSDGSISIRNADFTQRQNSKSFSRNDGTHFALVKMKSNSNNGLNKFLVIEGTETGVKIGKIYSENELVDLSSDYDSTLANGLLSKDRLGNKIKNFNGYVGFIGKNHGIYYDQDTERSVNIIR